MPNNDRRIKKDIEHKVLQISNVVGPRLHVSTRIIIMLVYFLDMFFFLFTSFLNDILSEEINNNTVSTLFS